MANSQNIVRLACDLSMPLKPPVNVIDGLQVRIHRGKAYRFEIGIFDKEVWQESISQFSSVTLQVRATRTSAAIIDKTVSVVAATVAESAWDGRTDQHVVVTLTGAQTNALTVPSPFEADFWFVLTGTISSEVVTLTAGTMKGIEDGGQYSGSTPVSGDPTYLTAAQTIAAIESAMGSGQIGPVNGFYIIFSVDDTGIVTFNARPA